MVNQLSWANKCQAVSFKMSDSVVRPNRIVDMSRRVMRVLSGLLAS